jgi:hypothetical protein
MKPELNNSVFLGRAVKSVGGWADAIFGPPGLADKTIHGLSALRNPQ